MRSSGCMMSETLTLMVAAKACQASDLGTGALGGERFADLGAGRIHMKVCWEQSGSMRCLKGGQSGKRQRFRTTALFVRGSNQ